MCVLLFQDACFCFGFIIHSELIAIQQSHCLCSSKSALREDEKFIETESSSDKKNSSEILLVNKDAALPSEKVCISLRNTQLIQARLRPSILLILLEHYC